MISQSFPPVRRLLAILAVSSALSMSLWLARAWYTDSRTFFFLNWNLLLAWIPLGLALLLWRVQGRAPHRWLFSLALCAAWLLFFPTGVVGALCIALLLVFAPALLQNLPNAALGAVVIASCLSLVDVKGIVRLYRLRRGEFALAIVCFLGVALVGVIQGIFIAVALALLGFIWRAWRPYDAVLGRVAGLKGYHDVTRYPEAARIPGLVLFRWDAPLFFANAEVFREHVLQAVADAPTPTRWVVVAAEPVTDIDITASEALSALDDDLQQVGIELCFAEMKDPVKDRLKQYGLFTKLGEELFFPTIGRAVDRYLQMHPVEWADWEETLLDEQRHS